MATFNIFGAIVDTDAERTSFEDVTPAQVNAFVKKLQSNDELVIEINSPGGSCTAGLTIVNILKKAKANGHKTTAKVIGVAASMASVIACACDKLVLESNAFLMVHNPWSQVAGNAIDLRKEAETLDNFKDALIAIYLTKFDMDREQLSELLDAETWILGTQASQFNLKCDVIETSEPLKIAASAKDILRKFNNWTNIENIIMNEEETKETEKPDETKCGEQIVEAVEKIQEAVEQIKETVEPADEEKKEDEPDTEKPDNTDEVPSEDVDAPKTVTEEQKPVEEEMIAKAECDKRVSGMQSQMAKQIAALHKEYDAKILDFSNQLKAKDEELSKVKAEFTSLKSDFEKCNTELSEKTSALAEKENALATLNANVNKMPVEDPNAWRKLHGKEFFDYIKKNNIH